MAFRPLSQISKFYRVSEWIHLLGLCLIGFVYSPEDFHLGALPLPIVASSFYLAFGFSSNTVLEGYPSMKTPMKRLLLSFSPGLLCLLVSYFSSAYMVLTFFICIVLSVLYSAPFPRLKNVPFIGLFLNSSLFTAPFLAGYFTAGGQFNVIFILLFAMVFSFVVPFQLVHEMEHLRDDTALGYRTTAAYASLPVVKLISASFLVSAILSHYLASKLFSRYDQFILMSLLFSVFLLAVVFRLREGDYAQFGRCRILMRMAAVAYGVSLLVVFFSSLY